MMYSVDVIAASSSFPAADPTNIWLVIGRTDIYRQKFLDHDLIAAGAGLMDLDQNNVFYEKKSRPIAVPVICRSEAGSPSDNLYEALSLALSEIGIEECVHPRLIYDLTQTCHARTGKWIVPAIVLVRVDHRFPSKEPGSAQYVAGLPRKRRAVSPSDAPPCTPQSEEELPTKRRRRSVNWAQNWPVANLLPEFDGAATTALTPPPPEDKRALLWRQMCKRRVAAVRTVPNPPPPPEDKLALLWRQMCRRRVPVLICFFLYLILM